MQKSNNVIKIEPEWTNWNSCYLPFVNEEEAKDLEIFYGGSSSGKSKFIADRCVLDIMSGGHNYLCIRKLGNSISGSMFNEIEKSIIAQGVSGLFSIVESRGKITCINGYQILFKGMDDPEKVKSITPKIGVITDIWYEEATESQQEEIKQLDKRLRGFAVYQGRQIKKRIILSFNPIYKTHWLVAAYFQDWKDDQTFFEDEYTRILKTTYKDNRFLTRQDVRKLENEIDEYWYNVYTLGNWGVLGDAIYKNWTVEDLTEKMRGFDNHRNGLDFGFGGHPCGFVRMHLDKTRKIIYVLSVIKEHGLVNDDLYKQLEPITGQDEVIWCDNEDPKSIKELSNSGLNTKRTKKGPGSVRYGITWIKGYSIVIHHTLQQFINEITVYQWIKDRDGNSLSEPLKKDDDLMDGMRYGLESDMGKGYSWA